MTTEELETEIGSMLLYQEHGNTVGEYIVWCKIVRAHAEMETRIAALEQRADDAELIAWGLANRIINRFGNPQMDGSEWFVSHTDYKVKMRGNDCVPILTPAAREALRKAKEQSK